MKQAIGLPTLPTHTIKYLWRYDVCLVLIRLFCLGVAYILKNSQINVKLWRTNDRHDEIERDCLFWDHSSITRFVVCRTIQKNSVFFRWWVWLRSSEAAWSHFTHSFEPVWSASLLHVRGFLESQTNKQVVRSPAYGTKHMKTYRKDSGLLGFFNVSLFVWSICTFI